MKQKILLLIILITLLNFTFATQVMSLHGKTNALSGDIRIYIYDANTGGNLVYDSGTDFTDTIRSGIFDVQLGSITSLDLNYGQNYYLQLQINGTNLKFNGEDRQLFQSTGGNLTNLSGNIVTSGNVTATNYYGNGSNLTGITATGTDANNFRGLYNSTAVFNGATPVNYKFGFFGDSVIYIMLWTFYSDLKNYFGNVNGFGIGTNTFATAGGSSQNTTDFTNWITGITYTLPADSNLTWSLYGITEVRANEIKIYYIKKNNGGTFKVQKEVNGGGTWADIAGSTTDTNNAGTAEGGILDINVTKAFLKLRVVGLSGTSTIIDAAAYVNNESGFTLVNFAMSGIDLSQMTTSSAIVTPIVADVAPDLLIYSMKDPYVPDFNTYFSGIKDKFDAGKSTTDWYFVGSFPYRSDALTASQRTINAGMKSFCDANHYAYIDLIPYFIDGNTMDKYGFLQGDGVHLTTAGNEYIVPIIMDRIVNYFGTGWNARMGAAGPHWFNIDKSFNYANQVGVKNNYPDAVNGQAGWYIEGHPNAKKELGFNDIGGTQRLSISSVAATDQNYWNGMLILLGYHNMLGMDYYGRMRLATDTATAPPGARLEITDSSTAAIDLLVNGITGKTADLQRWAVNGGVLSAMNKDGNLGLGTGTSSIPNKLKVIGDVNATGSYYGDGSHLTGLTGATDTNCQVSGSCSLVAYLDSNNNFDSGTLFVNATGNKVGIGTTNPVESLNITAAGTSAGMRIDASNAAGEAYINLYTGGVQTAVIEAFGGSYGTTDYRNALSFTSPVDNLGTIQFLTKTSGGLSKRLFMNNAGSTILHPTFTTQQPTNVLTVIGDINATTTVTSGTLSTQVGRGVCIKAGGTLGYCSTDLNADGYCTCN